MVYSFQYRDAEFKFLENRGRAKLKAPNPENAIQRTRELFPYTRDESVRSRGQGLYIVSFKVSFRYRRPLLRTIKRAIKLSSTLSLYRRARYIDRYIVATACSVTGHPDWLTASNLREEIRAVRKASLIAHEVPHVMAFMDLDIAIYNYLELNPPRAAAHRSRVRRVAVASA